MSEFMETFIILHNKIKNGGIVLYLIYKYANAQDDSMYLAIYKYLKITDSKNAEKWVSRRLMGNILEFHPDLFIKYAKPNMYIFNINTRVLIKHFHVFKWLFDNNLMNDISLDNIMHYIILYKKYDCLRYLIDKLGKEKLRFLSCYTKYCNFVDAECADILLKARIFDIEKHSNHNYSEYSNTFDVSYKFLLSRIGIFKNKVYFRIKYDYRYIHSLNSNLNVQYHELYIIIEPDRQFKYENNTVEHNWFISGFRKELTALIINNELCRSVCNWPLFKVEKLSSKIPAEVAVYLDMPGFYLAGGILTRIIVGFSLKNRDFDIFYVGPVEGLTENLNNIRNKNPYLETENSITIYSGGYKIQFIKRVYGAANHVVGGFDLDSCRFILIDDQIWGTANALWSVKHKLNCINEMCASETFIKRIKKYKQMGFEPVYYKDLIYRFNINSIHGGRSYDFNLKKKGLNEENFKHSIYINIIKGNSENLCIWNKKYALEEFGGGMYSLKFMENYEKYYAPLTKCRISNPTTQYTGSFFPININLISHAKKPINHRLSWDFPYVAYLALRSRFYPKLVKYILCFV